MSGFHEVRFPDIEANKSVLVRWLKQPGDWVEEGEDLVEMETDKVNFFISSPFRGRVHSLFQKEGAEIRPGDVLALIAP